jgi:hypothetical protein
VTVVSGEFDKNGNSVVVGPMRCSTIMEDALALSKKAGGAVTSGTSSTQTDTLLLREYKDAGYGGPIYDFVGTAGPCDFAGYRLVNFVQVEINVSSIQGFNNCNRVQINDEHEHYGFSGCPGTTSAMNGMTTWWPFRYFALCKQSGWTAVSCG